MVNKALFKATRGYALPMADTLNKAGGVAYRLAAEEALAQYAVTGCFNNTFYANADEQLDEVLALAHQVDALFIAKLAVYARQTAHMKDMPALLLAVLSTRSPELFKQVFERVIDNGTMLRNFVQVMRSGVTGRKSLGTLPKRMVQNWFNDRSDAVLLNASVGTQPSLSDVLKMTRPRPQSAQREALYGYLIGKPVDAGLLPDCVQQYESFKQAGSGPMPDVDFRLLTAVPLQTEHWVQIARNAGWQMTRMNLNTFARHGVFGQKGMTQMIANRLRDEKLVRKARVFPYQLMAAFKMADDQVPVDVRDALQDAMEIALRNVPALDGHVYVCPDTSGSMGQPVTGYRKGASTKIRCVDVAALITAALLHGNRKAVGVPFDTQVHDLYLNRRDSVLSNTGKLAALGGGGTDCSAPLRWLNQRTATVDLVVLISDNESWFDPASNNGWMARRATPVMREWVQIKQRNPQAKLVCIDLVPNAHTQAGNCPDILNVGGFSDAVFTVLAQFAKGNQHQWLDQINGQPL